MVGVANAQTPGSSGRGTAPAARSAGYNFSIPPQPLAGAISAFSRVTGIDVVGDGGIGRGVGSPGVSGNLTPHQALTRLLAGTGLSYRFTNASTVAIQRPNADGGAGAVPSGAIALDTIDVQGASNPNALIGNLPPEYAGGQVARGGQLGLLGNRDLMNTPFNQTSYTSKLMQNQQIKYIADVLQNDPSVLVDTGPSGGADNFIIRGFDAGNGDMLFNGMAGIAPTWFNSMMSESIERVEVLKGPSALLNGAGALGSIGGMINLVPKRAGDDPLTQATLDHASNSQFGGHVDIGRRFGGNKEFGVRFNGVYRDGDTPIDHQSRESRLATLALDYRGERLRLSADLGYQYQNLKGVRVWSSVDPGVAVPPPPNTRTNASPPWGYVAPEVFYGVARGEFDLTSNITAFAAVGGNQRKQPSLYVIRSITDSAGTLGPTTAFEEADAMYTLSTEAGVRGNFETGPIKHQATVAYSKVSIDWRRVDGNSAPVPTSNIYSPVFGPGPAGPRPNASDARPLQDISLSGITMADTLSIFDDRIQVTGGVRFQEIEATRFNISTGAVRSNYDEKTATPMVGVVLKPWSNVSLYGNYIEGLQQGPVAPLGAANAGEIFSPYVAKQTEVGLKVDFGRITTTLSTYQLAKPVGYVDPTTNLFGVYGDQRHRGIELNVFGELTESLRLLGGANYIESVQLNTGDSATAGKRGVGVPEYRLVAGAEWDTPFVRGLTFTGRFIYNGSQFVDPANTQEISGWTRVDFGGRYTIEGYGMPIVIRANIQNVFDTRAWIGGTFGGLTPNDPRTFRLSTTFQF
ncbi:MAG: TonB-dependent receptor [Nitrobacter sp.]|uniref:TonB-dependent receptor n=1 Tax=Nitrobacter sp. TaxID=29420 RepID=UPI0026243252|nr:TonB-dependent receptor [Nitrobacter sp.]MCV0387466.1 TonB-dependent receptor [Nitrobacter sp.]